MSAALRMRWHVSDRSVVIGIALSIILHAVVLFMFPAMRHGPSSPGIDTVLRARLVPRDAMRERPPMPEREPRRPEPVRPTPPPPVQPKVRPVERLAVPTTSPTVPRIAESLPTTPPAPTPPTPPTPPIVPAPAVPAAASASSPAPPLPAGAASRSSPAGSPDKSATETAGTQPNPDAGSIDQFRQNILIATRRYKRYPAQAMDKGWQGRVEIRLVIGSNGMTQSYVVKTSSGFQLLDETAMDMVKKGRPWVQVPPALRGREFVVDVPVIFDLRQG